jgi:ABC-2 type transport system ATP-binding protein
MWEVIADLVAEGVTVFLTTQYLEEADRLADRIAVVDAGRVVADGTPAELKTRFAEQRLEVTVADQDRYDELVRYLGGRVVHRDAAARVLGVATDGTAAHVRAVLDELDPNHRAISRFEVRGATLDDVFLALTGHVAAPQPAKETVDV